jgi:hypothetical protein
MADKPYRFLFRMPEQLRARLVASAQEHGRSLNSELLSRLERSLEKDAAVSIRERIGAALARPAPSVRGARRLGVALATGLAAVAVAAGVGSWSSSGSAGDSYGQLSRPSASVSKLGPFPATKWYARAAARRASSP